VSDHVLKLESETLEQLRERAGHTHDQWPESLQDLRATVKATLGREGIKGKPADVLTDVLIVEISILFGGHRVYIPRGELLKKALRDQQIYERLGRESAADLATEYGMSEQWIYEIAGRQKQLLIRRTQGTLFD
jgi:Mor family transcriptional regulator